MIEKLVIQKLTIAGKEYEYPDTTALVGKINELADAVNELQESQNTYWVDIAEIKKELQTRAENVTGPIKLYVCADGSVYDNLDVAKSHAVSIFSPLPAGATTTDRVCLERDLEIAIDALNKIALVDDAGAQMVATAREALTKIGNITPR